MSVLLFSKFSHISTPCSGALPLSLFLWHLSWTLKNCILVFMLLLLMSLLTNISLYWLLDIRLRKSISRCSPEFRSGWVCCLLIEKDNSVSWKKFLKLNSHYLHWLTKGFIWSHLPLKISETMVNCFGNVFYFCASGLIWMYSAHKIKGATLISMDCLCAQFWS